MPEEDFETLDGANEKAAQFLGYCGFAPVVIFTIALWLPFGFMQRFEPTLVEGFLLYNAIVLTFLGGIHFGKVIHSRYPPEFQLVLALLPSMFVWFAFMMPKLLAFIIFIAAYIGQWIIDREIYDITWLKKQRTKLTLWTVICQILACIAMVF